MIPDHVHGTSGNAGSLEWSMVFEPGPNITVVRTKGPIDSRSMAAMLQATAEFTRKHGSHLILADHRASELMMDVFEAFNSPRTLTNDRVALKNRAALVYSKLTENHRFLETIFRNEGRAVALFTDLAAAREWLIPGSGV